MLSKAVVAAVAVLMAVAGADALRKAFAPEPSVPAREGRLTSWRIDRGPSPCRSLVPDACGRYFVRGGAVERSGEPFLGRVALAGAFPSAPRGSVEAVRVADGFGRTLAIAVRDRAGRGAVQLWRDRQLVGSFPLSPSSFAGGLGFSPGGHLVAAFDDRGQARLYDLRGNEVAVAGRRRPG